MDGTKTMNKLTAFLLALPLAAQTVFVLDDATGMLIHGKLDPDIEWDRQARRVKKIFSVLCQTLRVCSAEIMQWRAVF